MHAYHHHQSVLVCMREVYVCELVCMWNPKRSGYLRMCFDNISKNKKYHLHTHYTYARLVFRCACIHDFLASHTHQMHAHFHSTHTPSPSRICALCFIYIRARWATIYMYVATRNYALCALGVHAHAKPSARENGGRGAKALCGCFD